MRDGYEERTIIFSENLVDEMSRMASMWPKAANGVRQGHAGQGGRRTDFLAEQENVEELADILFHLVAIELLLCGAGEGCCDVASVCCTHP
jgi:hypothetical protein